MEYYSWLAADIVRRRLPTTGGEEMQYKSKDDYYLSKIRNLAAANKRLRRLNDGLKLEQQEAIFNAIQQNERPLVLENHRLQGRVRALEDAIADFLDTDPYYSCGETALRQLEEAASTIIQRS